MNKPMILILSVMLICIIWIAVFNEEKIESNGFGIHAVGKIVEGTSIESKLKESYKVVVEYTTNDGKIVSVKKVVSKSTFESFHKGQDIDLVYSSSNPNKVDLLTSKSSYRQVMGSEERDFEVKDLVKLISKDHSQIKNFLNKINFGWDYYREEKPFWYNKRLNEAIRVIPKERVKSVLYGNTFNNFARNLQDLGFQEVKVENGKIHYYESEFYFASLQIDVEGSSTKRIGTILDIKKK